MGNYCIMNHKKVKRSDNIRGLQAEANREYEDENRYRNSVDLSRSNQNVTLVHSDDWKKSISDAIAKADLSVNKDSILAISTVYTASPEWFEEHPDKQEQIAYFKECLAFHEKRFGKVFNAVIHFDETTPHMQVISVPILEVPKVENYWICNADGKEVKPDDEERWGTKDDRKRKQRKILDENGKPVMSVGLNGAWALGGKTKLSRLQTEFAKQVGKTYGMERGKCRIDSDEQVEHETALQHKVKVLEQQIDETKEELDDMRTSYRNVSELCRKERMKLESFKDCITDICEDMNAELQEERYFDWLERMETDAQKAYEWHMKARSIKKRENAVYQRENAIVSLPQVHPDDDFSRKKFMESIPYRGATLESYYQSRIAKENTNRKKAKNQITAEQLVKNVELGIGFDMPKRSNDRQFGS